jgi:hypothetical protein
VEGEDVLTLHRLLTPPLRARGHTGRHVLFGRVWALPCGFDFRRAHFGILY